MKNQMNIERYPRNKSWLFMTIFHRRSRKYHGHNGTKIWFNRNQSCHFFIFEDQNITNLPQVAARTGKENHRRELELSGEPWFYVITENSKSAWASAIPRQIRGKVFFQIKFQNSGRNQIENCPILKNQGLCHPIKLVFDIVS